ncbi:hypothetical protein Anas_02315 [Armadillidium nasatum]|uniref:Uncharacterized protein n=1 Tax=Armadillidium nasatum TaxID=96803 RepID=A0A5N5SZK8_9CRUS|nr:hypothetical protein Anas_02315 [Armadillidium nasatum]
MITSTKILLSAVTASAGLAGLLFLLVPPARIVHTMPNILPIEISCSRRPRSKSKDRSPLFISLENIETLLTIPDSNLKCKNSTNCYDEDNLPKSISSDALKFGETASINDPIYSMNVIKRINSTYESDKSPLS